MTPLTIKKAPFSFKLRSQKSTALKASKPNKRRGNLVEEMC